MMNHHTKENILKQSNELIKANAEIERIMSDAGEIAVKGNLRRVREHLTTIANSLQNIAWER